MLAYKPHLTYPYPMNGDEFSHIAWAKLVLEEGKLPFKNPYIDSSTKIPNYEFGFHLILAFLFWLLPGDPVLIFKFLKVGFIVINSLLLFYFLKVYFKEDYIALLGMAFFGMIPNTQDLLGNNYLIAMTAGISFLLLGGILLHKITKIRLFAFSITMILLAVTYPPFFIFSMLVHGIFRYKELYDYISKNRLVLLSCIILAGGGILAVLHIGINKFIFPLTWTPIDAKYSPVFFFFVPFLFAIIGLKKCIKFKQWLPLIWSGLSLGLIYFYYLFSFSILIPFQRACMLYFIGISILAGVGMGKLFIEYKNFAPFLILIMIIPFAHAWTSTPKPIPILNENTYMALLYIKDNVEKDAIVASDSLTSIAIYPVTGNHILSMLASNLHAYDSRGTIDFLNANCTRKIEYINKMNSLGLMKSNHYFLLKEKSECDFFEPVYLKGPYLYKYTV